MHAGFKFVFSEGSLFRRFLYRIEHKVCYSESLIGLGLWARVRIGVMIWVRIGVMIWVRIGVRIRVRIEVRIGVRIRVKIRLGLWLELGFGITNIMSYSLYRPRHQPYSILYFLLALVPLLSTL